MEKFWVALALAGLFHLMASEFNRKLALQFEKAWPLIIATITSTFVFWLFSAVAAYYGLRVLL